MPALVAAITEQHSTSLRRCRGFMADLAGLVQVFSCQVRIVPKVDVAIVTWCAMLLMLMYAFAVC